MTQQAEILIAGGGLAGLTSAIHLSRQGHPVILIEKEAYPRHKVCGEYISNEILTYLEWLNADVLSLKPARITHLELTSVSGKRLQTSLPLGGLGLSRYAFDHYLYTLALKLHCTILQDQVTDIDFHDDHFEINTYSGNSYHAKVVIGAFGKRSLLDVKLSRSFINRHSPWIGVKGHYTGVYPDRQVGLYSFDGGYCGVSKVEHGIINICYLVQMASFKKYKGLEEHRKNVLCKNPVLKEIFDRATPLFGKPITISQVSFARKKTVEDHILMTGDTAGLIHSFCGNGMAMAIHSAKIASELVLQYLDNKISREEMEQKYTRQWNRLFRKRISTGRKIAALLQHQRIVNIMTWAIALFPGLLPSLIRKTHGSPVKI